MTLGCSVSPSAKTIGAGFYISLPKHGYQVVNEADELNAINVDALMEGFLRGGLVKEWQLQAGARQFEETPWRK